MDALLVPQPADTDGDAHSDATESSGIEQDEDGVATTRARGALTAATTESPRKKQRVSEEQPCDVAKLADYSEDDCDETLPPCITSNEAAATVANATGNQGL